MIRVRRVLLWIAAAIAALLAVAVVVIVVVTHMSRFDNFMRGLIVSYLHENYRGQITIARIDGSVWSGLTLRDVTVDYGGSRIASIPAVRVHYSILPMIGNRILVSRLEVIQPNLQLARTADGQWNLLAALASRAAAPAPKSPSKYTVIARSLAIQDAGFSVTPAPGRTYQIAGASLEASGEFGPKGNRVTLTYLRIGLSGPGIPATQVHVSLDYDAAGGPAKIKVSELSLRTAASDIELNGTLTDLQAKNVNAAVNIHKLAADDLALFAPKFHLARDLSGSIRVSGNAADLHTILAIAAGAARADADIHADIAQPQPSYKLDARLANLDLHKLLTAPDQNGLPGGTIKASLTAGGTGTSLSNVGGMLKLEAANLSMRDLALGNLTMTTDLSQRTATLKADLAGPQGRAQASGRIDIANEPSYDLTLATAHLRPDRLARAAKIPAADLNLVASVKGTGIKPASMRSQAQVKWMASTVGKVKIDRGQIDARIAAGILHLDNTFVKAGGSTVSASGQFALTSGQRGHLNYALASSDLSPWIELSGHKGGGQGSLKGELNGQLTALQTRGTADFSNLKYDQYSAGHSHATYDLSGLGKPMRPGGRLTLAVAGLNAGVALKSLQTSVALSSRGAAQSAIIDLAVQDRKSHRGALRAQVAYQPSHVSANLSAMSLETDHGAWRLRQPAEIAVRGQIVEIRRFAAVNQDQSILLDGTLSKAGRQDLSARIERIRIADYLSLMAHPPKVDGLASAQVLLRGTAAAPIMTVGAQITPLTVENIRYAGLTVQAAYQDARARTHLALNQDAAHVLNGDGALPIRISWSNGFEHQVFGDVDLHAVSSGLDLAFLGAMSGKQITQIGGTLSLDVSAHGPLRHPMPRGYIRVAGAQLYAKPLAVTVEQGIVDVRIDPNELRLVTLSARAKDGQLTGSGAVAMQNGAPQRIDLDLAMDNWPAIATNQYDARLGGRLKLAGPISAMNLGGQLGVLSSVLRPDLSMTGGPHQDNTIAVVDHWGAPPQGPLKPPQEPAADVLGFKSLGIRMEVVIHRDTWIKTPDFAVEIHGDVRVFKPHGGDVSLSGEVNTVRGTLTVANRQFDITRGRIEFTGGHEIDPMLDLVAQPSQPVSKYQVSAEVSGTAKKPTLTLNSDPAMPQADIVSMLMFGKPVSQLGAGQQASLQQQAAQMAGGYAASQVGQAIAQSLGLENLGLNVSSASGVSVGHYVTKNVYVSASQSATQTRTRQAQIEYYVTPSISLGTSASTNNGNQIMLNWHKEY